MEHPQYRGLTAIEVEERRRDGRVNTTQSNITKPLSRIFFDNIFTLFNFVNVIIAVALILVQSYHNLLFVGVVLANTVIGIIQEIRSKRTLEKLSLLYAVKATVIRDGKPQVIPTDDIVEEDIILYKNGDQIGVDAVVIDGEAEINESLLTGEADPILKHEGDRLLSGSFVISGKCTARVERVGENSYAAKLAAEAKKYKRLQSQLMTSVNNIIRFSGFFMIPFAILLVARDWFSGDFVLKDTVTATAASLIGMMPQGLMLLTTVSLVIGVIKLARRKTLVQELYCIETLSRVSLICLDKTGTITKGTMSVSEVLPLSDTLSQERVKTLIAAAVYAIDDDNATATALKAYYEHPDDRFTPTKIYPFSSGRKWSAASFEGVGTIFLGAYDRLIDGERLPASVRELEQHGKRLLLAAFSATENADPTNEELVPMAAIVLEDEIRDNAKEILEFFRNEGVTLRVISGDHPRTVAAIAKKAGLENYDKAVDASTLTTPEALKEAAEAYTVFGRVSPEQKKTLVQLFKAQGHTVAMTGDGVNDVPALKESDCSVAIAAGSDAAKQVSQLVLLDSDFASLPAVVMEGRRVVNNITRTASLFLVKTVMSFLVTLCTILLPMSYPFEPLQLTLIGVFAQSIPGFFLTLEPSSERIRGHFMQTVLKNAVPSALIITLFLVLIQLVLMPTLGLSFEQASTLSVYLTGMVWLVQLFRIYRPFTPLRRVLWVLMVIGFFGGALLLANVLPSLFAMLGFPMATVFVIPSASMTAVILMAAVIVFPLEMLVHKLTARFFPKAIS